MCGIAGFYNFHQTSVEKISDIGKKMGDSIFHRGPDNFGTWIDKDYEIALIHRRLSILDLSDAGNQPMFSPSKQYVISYNGEVYNHLILRKQLEKQYKIQWESQSDTETILVAIEKWGIERAIKSFSGMFSIAIFDRKNKKLFLIRDRAGEKPLYYGWLNKTFIFASELKAIKQHPSFTGKINKNAINHQMKYGYVPAPYCIFENISKLEPGKILTLDCSNSDVFSNENIKDYWNLVDEINLVKVSPFKGNFNDALISLESVLQNAVSSQLISDVPIGAFLSGGIDSSLIVSIMQSISDNPINTFTIGFSNDKFNEASYAKDIAKELGTNHTEHIVSPDEALSVISKLPYLYDEPFSESSQIPTYLVSKLARSSVTVSLSGDAGDELFGGYNRHIYSQKWGSLLGKTPDSVKSFLRVILNLIQPSQLNFLESIAPKFLNSNLGISNLSNQIEKVSKALKSNGDLELYKSFTHHWPEDNKIVRGIDCTQDKLFYDQNFSLPEIMMINDFLSYLPGDILTKVDRAAMGVSLETRIPFLNEEVIKFAWSLPEEMKINQGQGKYILRKLLEKHISKQLFERPKQGFAIPIEDWLRGPLIDWAESILDMRILKEQGYFHHEEIKQKWSEHKQGKNNWQTELWDVLMFQAWLNAQEL
jgi:asparagine synthase (glutamine-hydrolysing)